MKVYMLLNKETKELSGYFLCLLRKEFYRKNKKNNYKFIELELF